MYTKYQTDRTTASHLIGVIPRMARKNQILMSNDGKAHEYVKRIPCYREGIYLRPERLTDCITSEVSLIPESESVPLGRREEKLKVLNNGKVEVALAAADYWTIFGEPTTETKWTANNYFEVEKVREKYRRYQM